MSHSPQRSHSGSEPSHATIFIWLFAVAAIWHYTSSASEIVNYWLKYDPLVTPLIFLSIATAFVAACFPTKIAGLLLLAGGQFIANILRYPFIADHLVMELFLSFSILFAYGYLAIKKRSLRISTMQVFDLFSPVGRWLLIIMYFFGTFHKINPGFLSVASSCALPFVDGFPLPDSIANSPWLQNSAMYGTLIIEGLAMLLLLNSRTKYFGMLLGMTFHFFVGISSYGTLAHFSAFALALHILFIPSNFGDRLVSEPWIPAFMKNKKSMRLFTITFVSLQVVLALHMMKTTQGFFINTMFATFSIVLLYLVFKHGKIRDGDARYRLRIKPAFLYFLPIWFFLHCSSPYIGLGTGGSIAMFSGLRTEGGVSNHYIIRKPLALFPYQDKIVYIQESANNSMQAAADDKQGIVMFDFQRHVSHRETLHLPIRLRVAGHEYSITDAATFVEFANAHFTKQSWLERKYMSFRLVDELRPNRCRH